MPPNAPFEGGEEMETLTSEDKRKASTYLIELGSDTLFKIDDDEYTANTLGHQAANADLDNPNHFGTRAIRLVKNRGLI